MAQTKIAQLKEVLKSYLGNDNVYYQPPETVKLRYPCIIISRNGANTFSADDMNYIIRMRYTLTYVSRTFDDPVAAGILELLPSISLDRSYTADNLYHTVYSVFY